MRPRFDHPIQVGISDRPYFTGVFLYHCNALNDVISSFVSSHIVFITHACSGYCFNFLSTLILKLEKDTLKCFGAHLWKLATDFPILNTVYTIVTLTYISGCEEDDCVRGGATCVQNAFFTLTPLGCSHSAVTAPSQRTDVCVEMSLPLFSLFLLRAAGDEISMNYYDTLPVYDKMFPGSISRTFPGPGTTPLTKMNFQQEKLSFEGN